MSVSFYVGHMTLARRSHFPPLLSEMICEPLCFVTRGFNACISRGKSLRSEFAGDVLKLPGPLKYSNDGTYICCFGMIEVDYLEYFGGAGNFM